MAFLKPKPIGRRIRSKSKPNCDKNQRISSIFDKIRDLCQTPDPVISPLDERLFMSTVFNDIKELCRRPQLLTTIDEQLAEENLSEPKTYEKRVKNYYKDTNDSVAKQSSIDSKVFQIVVKGKRTKSADNCLKRDDKVIAIKSNDNKSVKKRAFRKSSAKSDEKPRKPFRPILSLEIDFSSKISEYFEEFSKPKLKNESKNRRNRSKTKTESSQKSMDMSYEFISSPSMSTCNSLSYSMPATPNSSFDSCFSQSSVTSVETSSTKSFMSSLRKRLIPKYETYGQYVQKRVETESKSRKRKRLSKEEIDFKQKVLEWKANQIRSGNTTPLHDIQYLATPPGSPTPLPFDDNNSTNNELNAMIDSLENENFLDFDDNMDSTFNSLLSDLYSDIASDCPIDLPIT